jgi:hypothetical protein
VCQVLVDLRALAVQLAAGAKLDFLRPADLVARPAPPGRHHARALRRTRSKRTAGLRIAERIASCALDG